MWPKLSCSHLHLLIGLQAARHYAVPGADPLQDVLTRGLRALTLLSGVSPSVASGSRPSTMATLIARFLRGGSEPQAHHAPHDHHIHILHLHSLVSFPGESPGSAGDAHRRASCSKSSLPPGDSAYWPHTSSTNPRVREAVL